MSLLNGFKVKISITGEPYCGCMREVDAYTVDGVVGLAYCLMSFGGYSVRDKWMVVHLESGAWLLADGFVTPTQAQAYTQRIGKLYDWTRTATEIASDPDLQAGGAILNAILDIGVGVRDEG